MNDLTFSKEEIEYLIDSMNCLNDESSGYRDEYSNMIDKLDRYVRSNLKCFINRHGKVLSLLDEEEDKIEAEKEERSIQLSIYAAKRNLSQASNAIGRLKHRLKYILNFDGMYLGNLTEDRLVYIENSIMHQWKYIFDGYLDMYNILNIRIDEYKEPEEYVTSTLSNEELERILFPSYLLDEIDKITIL